VHQVGNYCMVNIKEAYSAVLCSIFPYCYPKESHGEETLWVYGQPTFSLHGKLNLKQQEYGEMCFIWRRRHLPKLRSVDGRWM